MTTIFLLFLFITQLIGFYFLVLLYMKVAKFEELEKKQRKLMDEMDASIGAYLAELKDENDRLIEKLAERDEKPKQTAVEPIEKTAEPQQERKPVNTPKVPVKIALQSYNATNVQNEIPPTDEVDERTRAFQLHDRGHSIEEIAKILGIGRTEVELLLKFRGN